MTARRIVGTATAILLGMCVATLVLHAQGLRINLSASEPLGLYWMQPYRGETLTKGALVAFCPPIQQQDYPFTLKGDCAGGTAPFFKEVIAVPGDRVRVSVQGVFINEQLVADSQPKDHSEVTRNPLPHWWGKRVLGPGEYWVYGAGDAKNSFDSRYFGPVQAGQIQTVERAHSWNLNHATPARTNPALPAIRRG
ncbi:MAG: conjugative transfer signal peptidase TraF [Burkholderiaceae bacterium]|jgi:conjugative transfer signal peptidase TraF|nr:conjugative transfer signal peptidase TraF [Burkholderiaceae bacterium]